MASDWYVRERGKLHGPYTMPELRSMRSKGQLNRFHQLSVDRKDWKLASTMFELFADDTRPQPATKSTAKDGTTGVDANQAAPEPPATLDESKPQRASATVRAIPLQIDPIIISLIVLPFPVGALITRRT